MPVDSLEEKHIKYLGWTNVAVCDICLNLHVVAVCVCVCVHCSVVTLLFGTVPSESSCSS